MDLIFLNEQDLKEKNGSESDGQCVPHQVQR